MVSIIDASNKDWSKLLDENNVKYEDLKKILNSDEFKRSAGNVIGIKTDMYIKRKSSIHGFGIFAKKDINKNDIIGIAGGLKNNKHYRSYLGRFTNHSNSKNIIFKELDSGDVIAVCIKNIKKDEEILVDYRDHFLKW